MWSVASRDCYDVIAAMNKVEGPQSGLLFAGRALLGVLAFELALDAARWVVSNSDVAAAALTVTAEDLADKWARVRSLRSDVIAHMDTWMQQDTGSQLQVDSGGISVRGELVFGFSEWRRWLDILEPWAVAQGVGNPQTFDETRVAPAKVPIERLRRPK